MLIKPTYDIFFRIVYTRGNDQQTTEIVDTSIGQVIDLVSLVVKEKLTHPKAKTGKIPSTNVKIYSVNGVTMKATLSKEYSHVYNQSPRNVRIGVEKSIANIK